MVDKFWWRNDHVVCWRIANNGAFLWANSATKQFTMNSHDWGNYNAMAEQGWAIQTGLVDPPEGSEVITSLPWITEKR